MSPRKNNNIFYILGLIIILLIVVIIFILYKNRELKRSCIQKQEYFNNLINNDYERRFSLSNTNYNLQADNTERYKKNIKEYLDPFLTKTVFNVIASLSPDLASNNVIKIFVSSTIKNNTGKIFDEVIEKLEENKKLQEFSNIIYNLLRTDFPEDITKAIEKNGLKKIIDDSIIIPTLNKIIDDLQNKIPGMFDYVIKLSYEYSDKLQDAIKKYKDEADASDTITIAIMDYIKSPLNLRTSSTYKTFVTEVRTKAAKQLFDNLRYLIISQYEDLSSRDLSDLYNLITNARKLKELFEKYGKILLCGLLPIFNTILRQIISEFSIDIPIIGNIDVNSDYVKELLDKSVYPKLDEWFGAPNSQPDCKKVKSLYIGYNYTGYTRQQSDTFNKMFIISFEKISEKIKNYKKYNSYNIYNKSLNY